MILHVTKAIPLRYISRDRAITAIHTTTFNKET